MQQIQGLTELPIQGRINGQFHEYGKWIIAMFDLVFRFIRICCLWKPLWLYELMPIVYISGGVAAIFLLENMVGKGSGALLIVAGIAILKMRLEYRTRRNNSGFRLIE